MAYNFPNPYNGGQGFSIPNPYSAYRSPSSAPFMPMVQQMMQKQQATQPQSDPLYLILQQQKKNMALSENPDERIRLANQGNYYAPNDMPGSETENLILRQRLEMAYSGNPEARLGSSVPSALNDSMAKTVVGSGEGVMAGPSGRPNTVPSANGLK